MAENETLTIDGTTASRWRPVRQRLAAGTPASACFSEVERQFYRGLRSACDLWIRRGVTLERLLTAALAQSADLEALVRQTRHQPYACVLLDVARAEQFCSLEGLVFAWLEAIWDSIRDQLCLDLAAGSPTASFQASVRAMLCRLARLIAANPTRVPSRPRRRPTDDGDDLDDLLNRPLL